MKIKILQVVRNNNDTRIADFLWAPTSAQLDIYILL